MFVLTCMRKEPQQALKQRDLAGVCHAREGPQSLELVNVGLGELVAAQGELLYGDELLPLPLLNRVRRRRLPQAPHGGEGRNESVVPLHCKPGGLGLIDADGFKPEPPEVELVAHLQRHRQILLHRRCVLVVPDTQKLPLHRLQAGAAVLRVKGLGADGTETILPLRMWTLTR